MNNTQLNPLPLLPVDKDEKVFTGNFLHSVLILADESFKGPSKVIGLAVHLECENKPVLAFYKGDVDSISALADMLRAKSGEKIVIIGKRMEFGHGHWDHLISIKGYDSLGLSRYDTVVHARICTHDLDSIMLIL